MNLSVPIPPNAGLSPRGHPESASGRILLDWLCGAEPSPCHHGWVVAAHPDDEVLGAGSRMPGLAGSWFLHVTDGAPRNMEDARNYGFSHWQEYAAARHQELLNALALAGIPAGQSIVLGYPDQETSFHLVELTRKLHQLLHQLEPEFILTHPYEGGHPDHDSTCFAVHSAVRWLALEGHPAPPILEFSSYHQGPNGIRVGEFLEPGAGRKRVILSPPQQELKRRLLDCFVTQRPMLNLFGLETECFRLAPDPQFHLAPHSGTLFYEYYPWGMDGARWRNLAEVARAELGLRKES